MREPCKSVAQDHIREPITMKITSYFPDLYESIVFLYAIDILCRPVKMVFLPRLQFFGGIFDIVQGLDLIDDTLYFMHTLCEKMSTSRSIIDDIRKKIVFLSSFYLLTDDLIDGKTLDHELSERYGCEKLTALLLESCRQEEFEKIRKILLTFIISDTVFLEKLDHFFDDFGILFEGLMIEDIFYSKFIIFLQTNPKEIF